MGRSCCKSCGGVSLERDDISGSLLCADCGTVLETSNLEAHIGGISGPTGTYVAVGTSGIGSFLPHREKKIFEARKLIDHVMADLGFSSKSGEVKGMIAEVTEGEYGLGAWFSVLIAACACVVMRRDNKSLPVALAASVVGCDVNELGRMMNRVVDFLELRKDNKFPVYNIVTAFDRAVKEFSAFSGLHKDDIERMHKQGMFLIQCAIKWFLTTGRRPLPVVVAVLVFIAELNEIKVKIDDVAREFHAVVSTAKRRYKEFLEALVEASRALPWGKDVTIKNIMKNAPFVIQYMETKSMLKGKGRGSEGVHLEDVIDGCLRKAFDYDYAGSSGESDSRYFDTEDRSSMGELNLNDLKISHECMCLVYSKFLEEKGCAAPTMDKGILDRAKRMLTVDSYAWSEWWKGKSDLSKKLLLEQILEKDVGMDPMPPSYVSGCLAIERRRARICAAKQRISRVMSPSHVGPADAGETQPEEASQATKKRKRGKRETVDWEDFIIETLLLNRVKEEEIEKGHYNTLLDLYVFNSNIM